MPDTTTDLAAAIRVKVAARRETLRMASPGRPVAEEWPWSSAQCDLADAILARHHLRDHQSGYCRCLRPYPCPDVRDLATAWGVGS